MSKEKISQFPTEEFNNSDAATDKKVNKEKLCDSIKAKQKVIKENLQVNK